MTRQIRFAASIFLSAFCIAASAGQGTTLDMALRAELLAMREKDQAIRTADPVDYENMVAIDKVHTARLKEIVAQHGWPTIALVGSDGAHAAWLLAQHADRDRDFQARVLALMKPLVDQGQATAKAYAYLHDRINTSQRYGTQGRCAGPGVWEPLPIEDEEHVEERRAAAGILPVRMADYKARFKEVCK